MEAKRKMSVVLEGLQLTCPWPSVLACKLDGEVTC